MKLFKPIIFFLIVFQNLILNAQSDACSGATNLPVNSSCSSQNFSVSSSFSNTGLINASCGTAGTDLEDGWYTISATSTSTTIEATPSSYSMELAAFSSCTSGELACSYVTSGTKASIIFNTTIGTTYYIQLHRKSGTSNKTMSGTICAYQTPPPPSNDDPCSATTLTVNTSCNYNSYTNISATATSGVAAPGCANYLGGDVWYTAVIPASGSLGINSKSSTITDGGMAIYYGTCNSLTLISCDDASSANSGNMPFINISTRPVGSTVYIRFWENGNNNNGSFQICASELNACGNDQTNDYCSNPAQLFKGSGNWSSSTSSTYTPDRPGNISSIFCGGGVTTIDNNSWYQFTASSTTETFNFSSVSNCLNNKGIQAQVFAVTNNSSSCCTAFTSKSNYYNPGNSTTLGTVTATGLTINQTYILMVDGYAGDQCDFTVTGWTATGILTTLSIELNSFYGKTEENDNILYWETLTEKNNDYFIIEKSNDGITFETVGHVSGNGTTNEIKTYNFIDKNNLTNLVYYRLIQVDINGEKHKFDIISLRKTSDKFGIINLYPNPTKNILYVNVNTENSEDEEIEIFDQYGNFVQSEFILTKNMSTLKINIENLINGLYFIRLKNKLNQSNIMHRFVIF